MMKLPRISRDSAIQQWNAREAGEGNNGLTGEMDYIGDPELPPLTDLDLEDLIEELDEAIKKAADMDRSERQKLAVPIAPQPVK